MAAVEDPHIKRFLKAYGRDNSENSVKTRRSDLTTFASWYADHGEGDDVTEAAWTELNDYLDALQDRGYAETTVESHYFSLRAMYDLFESPLEYVDENPMEKVKKTRSMGNPTTMKEREHRKDEGITHLSPNEKEQLCEHVPAPQIRNELLIRFLWQTGLREHEVRNVRLQDLDRDERIVNIYSEKVYKDREVGYQPSVDFLMNQWLDSGYRDRFSSASDSEYVFVSRKAEKLTEGRVNDVVKKAAENAGIQDTYDDDAAGNTRHTVTAHALRHSFAVQSLKNGMDVRFLQELMGHADISTTERYLKITGREAIEQQRKYGAGARQD